MVVSIGQKARFVASSLAMVFLVAGACSGSDNSEAATLTETKPPPPAETTQVVPPEPAPAEVTPPEPAPAEPSPPPEPAPAEPSPPPEPAPAEVTPPEPPPGPEQAPVAEGELDAAAVAALVSAVAAAQSGVTSSRIQTYVSLQLSFDGQSAGSVSDVPFTLSTTVGDRTHTEIDQASLTSLGAFEDGTAPAVPADLPPIEMILDKGAQQLYVKLAPLAAGDPAGQPFWPEDLVIERGGDIAGLWGRADRGMVSEIQGLDLDTQPAQDDFLDLLKAASDGGSVLEARSEGQSQLAGVAVQVYSFVIDLAALTADLPPFLAGSLGGGDTGAAPPEEFLNSLPPLPADFTLHVDGDDLVRQMELDLDLGAILMAVFAGFGELAETPDGAAPELPDIEHLLTIRLETLALNDPSLTVALPDPSMVVDIP